MRAPITVIPTGVPLTLFIPLPDGSLAAVGLAADRLVCLYAGRLDREKSVERVIDAFALIAGLCPTPS